MFIHVYIRIAVDRKDRCPPSSRNNIVYIKMLDCPQVDLLLYFNTITLNSVHFPMFLERVEL